MNRDIQIRPGVGAIVFNAERHVLLHRRTDNDLWSLPGGSVEVGESVIQAVIRPPSCPCIRSAFRTRSRA